MGEFIVLFLCGVGLSFTSSLCIDTIKENNDLKKYIKKVKGEVDTKNIIQDYERFLDNE